MKKIGYILLIALLVRLCFILFFPPRPTNWDDAGSWDSVGWNVCLGKGFLENDSSPTQQRPPAYPIFLAIVYFLFGHSFLWVKISQAVLDTFTVFILYNISKKYFDEKTSLLVSLVLALYPPLIVYNGVIGSEICFTFLLALTLLVLTDAVRKESVKFYGISGFMLGITTLARSTTIFYPVFLFIGLLVAKKKRILVNISILSLFYIIALLPWTLRNYFTLGSFNPISAGGGGLFWAGTQGMLNGKPAVYPMDYYYPELSKMPLHQRDSIAVKIGLKSIYNAPFVYLNLTLKKFVRIIFQPVGQVLTEKKYQLLGKLLYLIHFILLIFAVIGFILNRPIWQDFLPIISIIIYVILMHTLMTSIPRYRLPIEPYIVLFAVYGFLSLVKRKKIG